MTPFRTFGSERSCNRIEDARNSVNTALEYIANANVCDSLNAAGT